MRAPGLVYRPLVEIKPIVDLALAWMPDTATDQTRTFLACAQQFARRNA